MFTKLFKKILAHKIILSFFILGVIISGYFGYKTLNSDKNEVRYVLAAVEKGTLITSISGSGQVSVSNQVEVKPKASGEVINVAIKKDQEVKTGTVLVQLDAREAYKAIRDAEANLESAKLSLEKLKKPADDLSILQAENSLAQAKEARQKAEDDLKKAYEDGFNTVANTFLDLPNIITGLYDILFSNTLSSAMGFAGQQNIDYYYDMVKTYDDKAYQYKDDAYRTYQTARTLYDRSFSNYKVASRFSEISIIESLIDETYETTKNIAEAVRSTNNFIQFYKDKLTEWNLRPSSLADTHLANLNTYTGKTNTFLLNLLSVKRTLQTSKETIVNSDRTIAEKTESLAKLKAGADVLDIQVQELSIKQRQNALLDAREKLADYSVRAPFDGIIAKIDAKKGDSISSGTSVATLITKQQIAEISLNEVDVAKIKVGQKVTLTFDAVEGLTITGEVAEIDALGTVTQGVVTYNVKIVFDTQDERAKPGMSISASIITDVKQDVLLVSNSAVKSLGETYYVEMPNEENASSLAGASSRGISLKNPPSQQPIQIGLANDSFTEVISGLKEGDWVINQTITANATTQTQSQSTGFRIPGITGGGPSR